jgi:DNA polymerase-3 subunit beta
MKLDCPRKAFFEATSAASLAASSRTSVTILQHLKVEASETGIRVLGCDGEMWVERQIPSIVRETGSVCLQASLLKDIVSSLADADLELRTLDGQGALLVQGASEYRLQTIDAMDFPEPPAFGSDGELTLPFGQIKDAINSVIFAVSTDNHRQVLTGVLFQYDGAKLTLVATDTHRLAVKQIHQEGIGATISTIVPDKALRALMGMPVADDEMITLRFGDGRLGVEAGGAKVVSQLLAGVYPNWERVGPQESTRSWTVDVKELMNKVDRTLILARDNANRVRFKGEGDQIIIAAHSDEKGDAKEEVAMVSNNGDVEIAFNGRYVTDALKIVVGEGARFEMTESMRPAVVKPTDDDSFFCVIMPMALA